MLFKEIKSFFQNARTNYDNTFDERRSGQMPVTYSLLEMTDILNNTKLGKRVTKLKSHQKESTFEQYRQNLTTNLKKPSTHIKLEKR